MYPSTRAFFDAEGTLISLEVDRTQFHAMGAAHGSIYFKLIDDAAYFAAQVYVEDCYLLTAGMNINFTRSAISGVIECRGKMVYRGRNMLVAEAEITDAKGHLLATGRGTFMRSEKPFEANFGYRL